MNSEGALRHPPGYAAPTTSSDRPTVGAPLGPITSTFGPQVGSSGSQPPNGPGFQLFQAGHYQNGVGIQPASGQYGVNPNGQYGTNAPPPAQPGSSPQISGPIQSPIPPLIGASTPAAANDLHGSLDNLFGTSPSVSTSAPGRDFGQAIAAYAKGHTPGPSRHAPTISGGSSPHAPPTGSDVFGGLTERAALMKQNALADAIRARRSAIGGAPAIPSVRRAKSTDEL